MANETCPTCKFPFVYEGKESSFRHCSEFCARATNEELAEFRAATPGLYCVYPCPECGGPTEGVWAPDQKIHCYSCAPKVKIRERDALLKETMPYLPLELRARVEEALKS